jgi:hypothetical protein
MVEVARADREARGHFRLRFSEIAAEAAQAGTEEQLAGHGLMIVNSIQLTQVNL